jgi:predicted nuclease of restriction endonuclease-like RecB superfamily
MAFTRRDLRFTTRRGKDLPSIHPRLLRDHSMLPRIDIAIQYFESMLGRERRDFEPEVLVHFFGDHKLARCLVACLGRAYRFQAPDPAMIVGPAAIARLRQEGLVLPRDLRLHLFDAVNNDAHGFIWGVERERVLGQVSTRLGLSVANLERLLYLDADEHTLLRRLGAEPRPSDVLAQYNFGVLLALIQHAEWLELTVERSGLTQAEPTFELCSGNLVGASIDRDGATLRLEGRQDALGLWSRHGRRLARTLVQLLERARTAMISGTARLVLRGQPIQLRLTPELLDLLAGAPAPSTGWTASTALEQALDQAAALTDRGGLSIRRWPEPQAWQRGVVVPDLLVRGASGSYLVCGVRSAAHAERLAPIARTATAGEPLLFVGPPGVLASLVASGLSTVPISRLDGRTLIAALRAAIGGTEAVPALAPTA